MEFDRRVLVWLTTLILALLSFSAHASITSYFIYDESGHVIGEYDANGNAIQEHVYLGDRPVAVVTGGSSGGGTVDYVTTDQLNTPRAITDSSQTVLWSWNSDPFGNGNPAGSLNYNLRFPGQYYDQETGHNYNFLRDYDASTGRYIESDLVGLLGGLNTYAYALDNPLKFDDKFGLTPHEKPMSENMSDNELQNAGDAICDYWPAYCINRIKVCLKAECIHHDCQGHTWKDEITSWIPDYPTPDEVPQLNPDCHCTKWGFRHSD